MICKTCGKDKPAGEMLCKNNKPYRRCKQCAAEHTTAHKLRRQLREKSILPPSENCREAGSGLSVMSHEAMRKICKHRIKVHQDTGHSAGFWCKTCGVGKRLIAGEDVLPDNVKLITQTKEKTQCSQ